jgi:Cof subfamily protein (haloacid dehalogenase superfamily)
MKALFFDLDGTLLDHKKQITLESQEALKQCKANGIRLFIATARPPTLHKTLGFTQEMLDLFDGGVFCNGACVRLENKDLYHFVKPHVVRECLEAIEPYSDLNISLQSENNIHAFRHPIAEDHFDRWGIQHDEMVPLTQEIIDQTVKMLVFYDNFVDTQRKVPEELVQCLRTNCLSGAQLYWTDEGKLVQIIDDAVNKMQGIEYIRQQLHFSKKEIAVFGDDVNDVEMLKGYPNSIAMGNAFDHVKSVAAHVTLNNNADGIAYALKNILKLI